MRHAPNTRSRVLQRLRRDDAGVALVTVMMVIMVVTALATTTSVVAVRNLQNSNRDRQAGAALGASDAGVAQAVEYLRNNGAGGLVCTEATSSSCSSNPAGWSNPTSPTLVPLTQGGAGCTAANANNCAKVWIGVVSKFNPPTQKFGIYRVHSEGIFGGGPGVRSTVVDVKVTPDKYPIGVFGATLSGNGGTAIYTESLFTTQCVSPRQTGNGNGTRFSGQDTYWGIPASAHSTSHISSSNNCGSNGYIQSAGTPCSSNSALYYDQSGDGGLLPAGSPCLVQRTDGSGQYYPDGACPNGTPSTRTDGLCQTSDFTTTDLKRYGYRSRGLSDTQYAALKTRAQNQGLYNVGTGSLSAKLTAAVASGIAHPVVYWDCNVSNTACGPGSSSVSLKYSDVPSGTFGTAPNTSPCPSDMNILTVVVAHGSLTFQGGNSSWFDASFFIPDGSFNGNGGYNVLGTLFANNLDLGGNQTFQLDSCFLTNFPGPVLDVTQVAFREDDSKDAP